MAVYGCGSVAGGGLCARRPCKDGASAGIVQYLSAQRYALLSMRSLYGKAADVICGKDLCDGAAEWVCP